MEDAIFKTAIAAVASGDYCESDIKTIKDHLKFLNKQERLTTFLRLETIFLLPQNSSYFRNRNKSSQWE